MQQFPKHKTVEIANGASLSAALSLDGATVAAIVMPAAWTTANLTFQASIDGTNFFNVYRGDAGAEMLVTADASQYITIPAAWFAGATHIKIRSGTAASAVNQGALRTLTVATRPL